MHLCFYEKFFVLLDVHTVLLTLRSIQDHDASPERGCRFLCIAKEDVVSS